MKQNISMHEISNNHMISISQSKEKRADLYVNTLPWATQVKMSVSGLNLRKSTAAWVNQSYLSWTNESSLDWSNVKPSSLNDTFIHITF